VCISTKSTAKRREQSREASWKSRKKRNNEKTSKTRQLKADQDIHREKERQPDHLHTTGTPPDCNSPIPDFNLVFDSSNPVASSPITHLASVLSCTAQPSSADVSHDGKMTLESMLNHNSSTLDDNADIRLPSIVKS
jgi:hypothetical protein